ncbi:hypothetical protein LTR12_014865 [Friedmanniomyces endolithicus]|nr:hypothetical protein LTR12_014865 [Friedmanniomyces endolithicus]
MDSERSSQHSSTRYLWSKFRHRSNASGSTYILFFSSNCFSDGHYTLSYATSTSVTGPYTRAAKPLLQSGDNEFTSPGGADVHVDGQHMVFHAAHNGGRAMYQAVISVVADVVSV